jgi:hypothetical protein
MSKRSINRPHAGTPLGPLLLLMALLAGLTAAAPPAGVMALFGLLPTQLPSLSTGGTTGVPPTRWAE